MASEEVLCMIDKNIKKQKAKKYRTTWGILDPVTKVVPDKTKYSRKKTHKKIKPNAWEEIDGKN